MKKEKLGFPHPFFILQVDIIRNLSLTEVSLLGTVTDAYLDKRAFMDCLGAAATQGKGALITLKTYACMY